jgi:hydrogenase small subunit
MTLSDESFESFLKRRKVSRRGFLKFCSVIAATLALPTDYAGQIAKALAVAPRLPIVWLEFQDCTGDTESFLRAGAHADPLQAGVTDPNLTALLLDYLSVDYHETLMAPAGVQARTSLDNTLKNHAGQFVLVVEGSIPTALNGAYCTIAGETALSSLQRVSALARATIALGTCAYDGGLAAAAPNPTGATGVAGAVPGLTNLINLPGCPSNVVNLAASLVYFLTFQRWPDLDGSRRPYFAYGNEIHEDCERHDYYEQGKYVLAWGDAGHRQGWCLFRMGCKGPVTRSNCNQVKWNDGTNWPIGAGHGCVGCTGDKFWDRLMPAYTPLAGD